MKRRKLYISFLLGLCLCLFTAIFTACGKEETPPPTLENISVSGETEVFIDEFDYADYTITATYSDDSTKTATLTADNLSAEDNAKLSTVGTHALTVNYESVTCSWTVTLKNHDFAGLTFDDVTTTYDGTAKTLAVAGLPAGAQVSYDKATSYTNAGEYTVKATITLANYNPVELTATLTINKAVYDMSAVEFADKTVTYDGQAHSIEATNLPNGVSATYTNNGQVTANEYTVTASFTGDSQNYEPIANKTATLTINKATYDMTGVRFENTEATYDGQTHFVTATGLPSGVSVDWENNGKVNADTYTVTAKFTGDSTNYNAIPNQTTTLTIHKATITGITFTGAEYTYDGEEKSLAIVGTLPNGVTVSYTGNNQTNAGEYTVTATFSKNANYNDLSDMQATLKINKATYDMSGVVFKDKSVNYTGEAYSIEATNLPEGVSATYDGNNQTQAGEYTVTAIFKGDSQNYNAIPDMTATLKISASDLMGISFHDGEFTYDGTKKSIFITGTLPEGVTVDYTNNEQINANSYTVTATFTCNNGNYTNLPELTATLLIKKATYDMSGVVFKDKSVNYTGEVYSLEATNLPNGVTVDYENNNQTQAGEYTVTAIFKGDSQNYNAIPNMTAKLIISASDLTDISFYDGEFIYDGTKKSIFITGTLPEGVTVDYTNNEQINANSYTVTATFTCTNGNYTNLPELTATLTIKKAVYDMSAVVFEDKTVTYDGQAHSILATNLPQGVTAQYTGNNQINAGEYTVTATFTGDSQNYELIASKTATLTIKKAVYDMSRVVFADKTVIYDGQAHSILATNLPQGVTAQYTGDKQINAGEYEITATFTGDSQNYELIASKTSTLTIEQRELTLAFDGETTLKYNGKAQKTITVQATNLVNGDSVELTVSYNGAMIEAGEYIATATLTAHKNYKLTANNTVKVTITRATHTVTFKQDGVADFTREVLDLADLTNIPTPQHVDGYKFTWNRTEFTSITEDITVTANKELITYKIEYVLQYGTNPSDNPTTYTVESATFTLKNPANLFGMQFGGWYTSEMFLPSTSVATIGDGTFGDLKLYGQFIGYRVEEATSFEIDYSQGTPTISKTVPYLTAEMDLRDSIKVSTGCTWQVSGDELGTVIYSRKIVPLATGENVFYLSVFHPDGNHDTLYELHIYRLDMKAYAFMDGLTEYETGEIEELSSLNAPENPTHGGYTFDGWQINGEGALVQFPYVVTDDIVFVAKYTPIVYTATFYPNGGTLDEDKQSYTIETGKTFEIPTRDYYDFVGWYEIGTDKPFGGISVGVYGDKEFYAKWTPTVYTITYELNGGAWTENNQNPTMYTIETADIVFDDTAERAGYSFVAWYWDEELETQATGIACGSHGDKTVYAKWTPNLNTLKFDGNGATSGEMSDMKIYTDTSDTLKLNQFERIGYIFLGWSTTENGKTIYEDNADYTMGTNSEYTLFAVWGAIFEINDGEIQGLTEYGKAFNELIIPNEIDCILITSIGNSAFSGHASLTTITIPDSVTNIGWSAFNGCSSLTSVIIPDSVTSIGDSAFSACNGLMEMTVPFVGANSNVTSASSSTLFGYIFGTSSYTGGTAIKQYYSSSSYKTYYIPTLLKKVTIMGGNILDGAFYNFGGLTSVVIGDNVTSIGKDAFYNCGGLTSVVIGDNVTSIGKNAFYDCDSLTSVVIGDNVTSIGDDAFTGCSSLTSVYITDIETWSNISFGSYAGGHYAANPLSKGAKLYLNNELATEIEIPNTITEIKAYAFSYCDSLTSVTIPDSVTSIGYCAFNGCSGLTSVEIGDSVTSISSYAFGSCSSLTSVEIGDSVTSIGNYAFYNCSNLTNVTIPDSVTSIGENAFYNCSNLTSVVIGNGVTSIDEEAFYNCSGLTSIEIPDSVTSIGTSAFRGCSGLTSVKIGKGVTSIGWSAFNGCSGLTSVVIPDSVTDIGGYAFYDCSSLTGITFNDTSTWYRKSANMTGGTRTSVTSSSTNATYFKSTYYDYEWYKK